MVSSRITGTNEDISTYGSGARDYTSLSSWEVATRGTLTQAKVLECYADSASYADNVTLSGSTTTTSFFRIIRAASGHEHGGIPGSGVHFTHTSTAINLNEPNAAVSGISVNASSNATSARYGFLVQGVGCRVTNCIVKSTNSNSGAGHGFLDNTSSGTAIFVNNLAYECKTNGFWAFNPGTKRYYNCTSVGNSIGFRSDSNATAVCINCLGASNGTDFGTNNGGTYSSSSHNASSGTTAPGTNTRISQTFTFVNSGSDDYHLSESDAGARGFGTNLSGDSTFPFDDDIDGDTITTWSIGMDSISSSPTSWFYYMNI